MGDPLSIAASTAALLHIVHNVYNFYDSCRNETKERKELVGKLDLVQAITTALSLRKEDAEPGEIWYRGLESLMKRPDGQNGPLGQLKVAMEDLEAELSPSKEGWKKAYQKLRWHWDKDRFGAILGDIDRLCRMIDIVLNQDQFALSRTHFALFKRQQEKQQAANEEVLKKDIEKWLSPLQFLARQKEIFEKSFQTGRWLLDSPEFRYWTVGRPWQLRCYGALGSGKTVLSSLVVDHLQNTEQGPTAPVICLYLNEKESRIHTPENLLGSLIKQLIQLRGPEFITEELRSAYLRAKNIEAPPGLREIRKILLAYLANYDRVFLIVDGLDECSSMSRPLLENELPKLHPKNLSLLFTSRELEGTALGFIKCDNCGLKDIKVYWNCTTCRSLQDHKRFDVCQDCKEKQITCNKDKSHELSEPYDRIEFTIITQEADLKQYIRSEIAKEIGDITSEIRDERRHPKRLGLSKFGRECDDHPELVERIVSVVVAIAKGQFIFVKLYMDSLKAQKTLKKINETLDTLPSDIEELYENAMKRILNQAAREYRHVAIKVLSFVVRAHQPLTFAELKHALVVQPGDNGFDPEDDYIKEDILAMTQGLVTISNDDIGIVRIFHLSLQIYLNDNRSRWFPTAEIDIANACLAYLKDFDAFSKPCEIIAEFEAKRKEFPFVAYASQYWGDHVQEAALDPDVRDATLQFLREPLRIAAYMQAAWYTSQGLDSWDVREGVDPLHICAWFGLSSIITALWENDNDLEIDVGDTTHWQTPLMYACRRGHIQVVRQLLDLSDQQDRPGVRLINIASRKGRTALFEAIVQNQEQIVRFLLSRDELDVNAIHVKELDRTALMIAARLGYPKIVQHLLNHPDIEINLQDSCGYTALYIAAYKGFADVVQLLLANEHIDVSIGDYEDGRSALIIAAEEDNNTIVKLFLQHSTATASLKDNRGGTAMLRAIDKGCDSVIKTMAEYNLDFRCVDSDGRSLIHGASAMGYYNIIRLLKCKGLDQDARDKDGFTPLHSASVNGRPQAAKVLLEELGANSSIRDNYGRTPFRVAWEYGQTQVMNILKTNNTNVQGDPMLVPQAAELPIWAIVKRRRSDLIIKALAVRKSEFSKKEPGTDNNPLHCAVQESQDEILRMLLQRTDISPNEMNRDGRTPLHIAAYYGDVPATSILIEYGAKLDLEDRYTHTPLYIAHIEKKFAVAMALIEAGAKIDATKVNVQAMFFAAVELGMIKAMEILIDEGVEVLKRNEEGQTALQLATRAGNAQMIQLLESEEGKLEQRNRQKSSIPVRTGRAVDDEGVADMD